MSILSVFCTLLLASYFVSILLKLTTRCARLSTYFDLALSILYSGCK